MPRINTSKYIYSVSRIRAMENKLLGPETMDRMVDAQTPEQVFKILLEAGYGKHGEETLKPRDFEKLLTQEHIKLYRLLREMAHAPEMFDIFLQPYDFYNLKVIIKAEFYDKKDYDLLLTPKGTLDIEELKERLRERDFDDFPPRVKEALEEAIADLNHTRDPQTVDLILDRACHSRMLEMAEKIDNHFLKNFIIAWVDLSNIRIVMRLKKMNKDYEFMGRALLSGGLIKPEALWEIKDDTAGALEALLKKTPYKEMARSFFKKFKTPEDKIPPEQLFDDFILSYIVTGRNKLYGLEPLVGFLFSKEAEFRAVRTVMSGKLNNVSREKIRESLRSFYV